MKRRYDANMNATLPRLFSVDDAARKLLVPVRTMKRWIADGLLTAVSLPDGEPLVTESDLAAFIDSRRTTVPDSPTEI